MSGGGAGRPLLGLDPAGLPAPGGLARRAGDEAGGEAFPAGGDAGPAAFGAAVEAFGGHLPPKARELAERHWPGALTLVAGGEGFRVPDHAWTRRLLAACGGVLRVTSANLSGQRPATDAPKALADVGLSADIVADDGVSPGGVPSTVVLVGDGGELEILRKGAISI